MTSRSVLPDVYWTADVEVENWDRLVCVCIRAPDGSVSTYWHTESDAAVDALLGVDGVVFWHGGSHLDLLWLLSEIRARGLKPTIRARGSVITSIRVGASVHRDTVPMLPITLREWAEGTGAPKSTPDLPCKCLRNCGGVCAIRRGLRGADRQRVLDYCAQDCRALAAGIERLRAWQELLDIDAAWTLGGSAYRTVQRLHPEHDQQPDRSRARHAWLRPAYFGGRAQGFKIASGGGRSYDISSAYPSALSSVALPWGTPQVVHGRTATRALDALRPGVYEVDVTVDESHIPVLPWRSPSGRVAYPIGRLSGRYTATELAYAADHGARIDRVWRAQVWPMRISGVLTPWISRLWEARKTDPLMGRYVKGILNSLTGTYGTRPIGSTIEIDPDPGRVRACPCPGVGLCPGRECACRGHCTQGCEGLCGGWRCLSPDLGVWERQWYSISDRSRLEWAIHLTSDVRVRLHRQLVSDRDRDGSDVVCCDTDGLISTTPRPTDPAGVLGGWRDKGTVEDIRVIHPRLWSATDPATGEVLIKASGHDRAVASDLLRDGSATVRRVRTLRSAVQAGEWYGATTEIRPAHDRRDSAGRLRIGDRIVTSGRETRAPLVSEVDA